MSPSSTATLSLKKKATMILFHVFLVAFAATFVTAKVLPPTNRALQDVITASLLQLKTDLVTGNRSSHIPPMDPLPLPHILVNHTSGKNMTAVSMNLTNIWTVGLSTFDPRRVVVVNDRIGMWLAFPSIHLNGTYALYGSLLGRVVKKNTISEFRYCWQSVPIC